MKYLQIALSVFSIIGVFVCISTDLSIQLWGFFSYMAANLCAVAYFYKTKQWYLLVQSLVFTGATTASIIGRLK